MSHSFTVTRQMESHTKHNYIVHLHIHTNYLHFNLILIFITAIMKVNMVCLLQQYNRPYILNRPLGTPNPPKPTSRIRLLPKPVCLSASQKPVTHLKHTTKAPS